MFFTSSILSWTSAISSVSQKAVLISGGSAWRVHAHKPLGISGQMDYVLKENEQLFYFL